MLPSMRSQRVGHNSVSEQNKINMFICMYIYSDLELEDILGHPLLFGWLESKAFFCIFGMPSLMSVFYWEEDTNFNIEVENTKYSFSPFSLIAVTLMLEGSPPTEVPVSETDPESKSTKRICVRCHPGGSSGRMLPSFQRQESW